MRHSYCVRSCITQSGGGLYCVRRRHGGKFSYCSADDELSGYEGLDLRLDEEHDIAAQILQLINNALLQWACPFCPGV